MFERSLSLARIPADDEACRHVPDILSDDDCGNRRGDGIGGQPQSRAEAERKLPVLSVLLDFSEEIFTGVTRDLRVGPERGQRVDQPEQIGLERGIAQGPIKHESLPVGGVKKAGLTALRAYDGRSPKSQMRQANKSGARFAVIIGPEELSDGVVSLRALRQDDAEGDQKPDQETVPRPDIVARLRIEQRKMP